MPLSFGITNARSVSFGSAAVKSMWYGNTKFYPSGSTNYIYLGETGTTMSTASTTAYVAVTASTSSWTVESSQSWITVSKTNSTQAQFTVSSNTGATLRNGTIYFKIGGTVYATYDVTQEGRRYVFSRLTQTPVNIGSTDTRFFISITSTRDGNSLQPQVNITYDQMNIVLQSEIEGGGTGQWNYSFSCDTNNSTTARTSIIQFTQPGSNNTLDYTINQAKKYVAPDISGITTYTTNGEWILGYVDTGIYETTGVHTKGIVLAYPEEISDEHTAILSMFYQTGPFVSGTSPTSYTLTDEEYTVSAGQTFNVSIDGTTYTFNGRWITYPTPGTQINYLSRFDIT